MEYLVDNHQPHMEAETGPEWHRAEAFTLTVPPTS